MPWEHQGNQPTLFYQLYTFGEKLMGNVSLEEDGILPMGERGGENPTYSLKKESHLHPLLTSESYLSE